MNFISKYFLTLLLFVSFLSISQESEEAVPTNLDKLLELVKEGKDQEQAENDQREEEFKNSRNDVIKLISQLNWKNGFYRKDIGYRVIDL